MKKLILILAVTVISCNPQDDLPTPQITQATTPIAANVNPISNIPNFEGNYNCYDWVASQITGATVRWEILMYNQSNGVVNLSLNQYSNDNQSYIQYINSDDAILDSNYFDIGNNPAQIRLKGFLINDTILRVTQYSGNVDFQTKDFIKE